MKRRLAPYLFISPFFIGYGIFFLYPMVESLRLSFYRQVGFNAEPRFVGLKNYQLLLDDDMFRKSLTNTTVYVIGSIFVILPLALLIATSLVRPHLRGREFFRLLYFSPNITSGVVVGIIFGFVFSRDFGLINQFVVEPLGFEPVGWLQNPDFIMPSLIIIGIWKFTGINALYFMVGLKAIPPELGEAASIDGASRWQIFRHVTLPMLRPTMAFVVTFAIIGSYNLFAEPVLLLGDTTGGPRNAGLTITMFLYNTGFRELKFGYASAVGYSLAVIICMLTLLQLAFTRGLSRHDQ